MMNNIPDEQLTDAMGLDADGLVTLFRIELKTGALLHLTAGDAITWQGNTYDSTPIHMEGIGVSSEQENNRPKFMIGNPDGLFSTLVAQGSLDNALITRIRVLRDDLDNDRDIKQQQSWRVRRVTSLNKRQITLELRDQMDAQFFQVPGRKFIPPEFPQVTLQ